MIEHAVEKRFKFHNLVRVICVYNHLFKFLDLVCVFCLNNHLFSIDYLYLGVKFMLFLMIILKYQILD